MKGLTENLDYELEILAVGRKERKNPPERNILETISRNPEARAMIILDASIADES